MPTKEECKRILSKIGFEVGVSPKLIATRLLSEDDKQDMMNGDLSIEALTCHVKVWKANGMADYANGNTEPMTGFKY
jgi:hypothetical protein